MIYSVENNVFRYPKSDFPAENTTNAQTSTTRLKDVTKVFIFLERQDTKSETLKHIASLFFGNKKVTELFIWTKELTSQDTTYLCELLYNLEELISIRFIFKKTNILELKEVCDKLGGMKSLTQVKIEYDNEIHGDGDCFADLLNKTTSLRTLKVQRAFSGPCNKIADALASNKTLSTLELIYYARRGAYFSNICDGIEKNTTISNLVISKHDDYTENDCTALSNAIKNNCSVRYLWTSFKESEEKYMEKMGGAIADNKHIENLQLAFSVFTATSFSYLIEGIRKNKFITTLSLSHCALEKKHAKIIKNLILMNEHIDNLSMHGNNFGDEGFLEFVWTLKYNRSIKRLSLDSNHVSDKVKKKLLDVLGNNHVLETLSYDINGKVTTLDSMLTKAVSGKKKKKKMEDFFSGRLNELVKRRLLFDLNVAITHNGQ